jgi:hypothetical protein
VTGTKADHIRGALLEEVDRLGGSRTTGRFLYYRLVARGIVPKDAEVKAARKPSMNVTRYLTELRETGLVSWDQIIDEGRAVSNHQGWPTIAEGLHAFLDGVRLDPWDGDSPLLVVESRSLAAFFDPVADRYRIGVAPLGGQSSGAFLHNDLPMYLGRETTVIYVGDWDKAGGDIETSAEDRLRTFVPRWIGKWMRVAVTDEQADRYRQLQITKPDRRFKPPRAFPTLEAEAIDQFELTAAVTEALDDLVHEPLVEVEAREEQERNDWRRRLGGGR